MTDIPLNSSYNVTSPPVIGETEDSNHPLISQHVYMVENKQVLPKSLFPQSGIGSEQYLNHTLHLISHSLLEIVNRLINDNFTASENLDDFTLTYHAIKSCDTFSAEFREKLLIGLIGRIDRLPDDNQYKAFCLFQYDERCNLGVFEKLVEKLEDIKIGIDVCASHAQNEIRAMITNQEDDVRVEKIINSCSKHFKPSALLDDLTRMILKS